MASPSKQSQDALRLQLNLKNLKRHDPSIESILMSTSYATIYYNEGADWVKTNIEGPLFIFSRTETPSYGFFVLNRNGLDYVKEFLTSTTEVKVEGEFILVEPLDAERATGIWVYEKEERLNLAKKMQELCQPVPSAPNTSKSSIPYNQSIPIDFLFASSNSNGDGKGMMPLPLSPPAPAPPSNTIPMNPGHPTGMQLLDSIFKSAQPSPPANPPPTTSQPRDARALLAMIGHPGGSGYVAPEDKPVEGLVQTTTVQQVTAQKPATTTTTVPPPIFAPPLLSHDLFSQPLPGSKKKTQPQPSPAAQPPQPPTQPAPQAPLPPPTTASKETISTPTNPPIDKSPPKVSKANGGVPKSLKKETALKLLDSGARQAGLGTPAGSPGPDASEEQEPMSKKEFVEALVGMLQNSQFSTKLYSEYLKRFSEGLE